MKRLSDKEAEEYKLKVAKDLEIDVKNIKFFSGQDGMAGINADLYYKGKKFAHGYDDSNGGGMDVRPSDYELKTMDVFHDIESKLKALPKYIHVHTEDMNGRKLGGDAFEYETQVDLADIVDTIALHKEKVKEKSKKDKKGIQYTKPDGDYVAHWNMSIPAMLKKYPEKAIPTIQKRYDELIKKYPVTNTDYLSSIGIRV